MAIQAITKRIQRGTITIAAGATSGTDTLANAVSSTSNAVAYPTGFTTSNTSSMDAAYVYSDVELTNTNTVTASRGAADATYAVTVEYEVWEFLPGVLKTNQSGSTICNSANNTRSTTLGTAVNLSNSFVIPRGGKYAPSGSAWKNNLNGIQPIVTLSSTTTIACKSGFLTGSDTNTISWTVLEFNTGYIQSVQAGIINITDPATSNTATLGTAVTPSNAMCLFMGWYVDTYAIGNSQWEPRVNLTDGSTVTARLIASAGFSPQETTHVYYQVVEFVDGIVKSKQEGPTTISGTNSSANTTVTSVDTTLSFLHYQNFTDNNSSNNSNTAANYPKVSLTSATNVQAAAGGAVASGKSLVVGWELLEFYTITGTGPAVTETADTMSASGNSWFTGPMSSTETADTMSASGLEKMTGTISRTQGAHTMSATGLEKMTGTAPINETADTMTAVSTQAVTGTGPSVTESNDTMSASGAVAPFGPLVATQTAQTMSASGSAGIRGPVSTTETADTMSGTGISAPHGALSAQQGAQTMSGTGQDIIVIPSLEFTLSFGIGFLNLEFIKFNGEPVPAEHVEDAQKLEADGYVDLFQIILSDKSSKIYLKINKDVDWQGNTYEGTGIQIDGVGTYSDDTTSRPKLTLFNPDGVFSSLLDQGLLDNATIVRYRVLKAHVDADLPIYRRQQWKVSRVASVKTPFIQLELRDMLDGQNFQVPGRMFIPPDFPTVSLN